MAKVELTALGEIGDPRAIEPLITCLRDPILQNYAEPVLLEKFRTSAVKYLITALKDKGSSTRMISVRLLGKIKDRRAVEPLIAVLENKNEIIYVRREAVTALCGIKDFRAVEPLITALKDIDSYVTDIVTKTLKSQHIDKPRILATLLAPLNYKNYESEVIIALKNTGDHAIEPLIAALKEKSFSAPHIAFSVPQFAAFSVRHIATKTLGEIKDPRAIKPLIDAYKWEPPAYTKGV